MMLHHVGNLFDLFKEQTLNIVNIEGQCLDETWNIIMHGCNAQGRMGSGFAKELRARYEGAYEEYKIFHEEGLLQVGKVVPYVHDDGTMIANCITQHNYGYDGKKYVSYDAIDDSMKLLNEIIQGVGGNPHLHFPKLGADLGGGDWNVIREIIDSRITNTTKHLYTLV